MYTDEDLARGVQKGIFTAESVKIFRSDFLKNSHTHIAEEENFKLVASFNDIFVVIAINLLLFSLSWVTYNIYPPLAPIVSAVTSWLLAEFFVLKRKMALPAILLLIAFVGAVFMFAFLTFDKWVGNTGNNIALAAFLASMSAWLHWKRFKVPITIAAGAITVVVLIISLLLSYLPDSQSYLSPIFFVSGIALFLSLCAGTQPI